MEPHLGMLLQEFLHGLGLVCWEVVEHDVNLQSCGSLSAVEVHHNP